MVDEIAVSGILRLGYQWDIMDAQSGIYIVRDNMRVIYIDGTKPEVNPQPSVPKAFDIQRHIRLRHPTPEEKVFQSDLYRLTSLCENVILGSSNDLVVYNILGCL